MFKKLLFLVLFVLLASFSSAVLTNNLVNYWDFNLNSSTQIDGVGSNDLIEDNTTFVSVGKINGGYEFVDVSGTMVLTDTITMSSISGDQSFQWWLKADNLGKFFMGSVNNGQNDYFGLTTNGLTLRDTSPDVELQLNVSTALNTGEFYHVVLVKNGTSYQLYVNGTLEDTLTSSGTYTLNNIGVSWNNPSVYKWDGKVDEVGYWDRALIASEVLELYNDGAGLELSLGIQLSSTTPTTNTSFNVSTINFTTTGNFSNPTNCSLLINGSVNQTMSVVEPTFLPFGLVAHYNLTDDFNDSSGFNNDGVDTNMATVGLWNFDGYTASDLTGNSNDGTISGGVSNVTGISGNGMNFDGTNGFIDVGSSLNLNNDSITIGWWMYRNDNYGRVVFNSKQGTASNNFYIKLNDATSTRVYFGRNDPGGRLIVSHGDLTGRWVYMVATKVGDTVSLYIDGVLNGTKEVTDGYPEYWDDAIIGAYRSSDGLQSLNGFIDEFFIYNVGLSSSEVSWLYNQSKARFYSDFSSGQPQNQTVGVFDRIDDYIDISSVFTSVDNNTQGSISFWSKWDSSSTNQRLFSAGKSGEFLDIYPHTSGVMYFIVYGGGSPKLYFNTPLSYDDGVWRHFVISVGSDGNAFYVDGEAISPVYTTGNANTVAWFNNITGEDNITIGKRGYNNDRLFNGSIADVQIYNRSLSNSQISGLYNASVDWINNTLPIKDRNINFSETFVDGAYDYNFNCLDIIGNNVSTNTNLFFVNTLELGSTIPTNNIQINATPTINFNLTGNLTNPSSCELYINNTLNQTTTFSSGSFGKFVNFNATFITGRYNYFIRCNDTLNNEVNTTLTNFTIVLNKTFFGAKEKFTDTPFLNFTIEGIDSLNNQKFIITTTNGVASRFLSAGNYTFNITNNISYYNKTFLFTTLTIPTTINNTLFDHKLNISSFKAIGGNSITNFTINITGNRTTETFSTTNGSVTFEVIKSINYSTFIDAEGYELNNTNHTDLTGLTSSFNYSLFQTNSVAITFKYASDLSIANNINITTQFLGLSAQTITTENGTIFVDLLTPDSYTIIFDSEGYEQGKYLLTVVNRTTTNITLYLTNESASLVLINVKDKFGNELQNVKISIQRWLNNTWVTDQILLTDFQGRTEGYYVLSKVFYNHVLEYKGKTRFGTINGDADKKLIFAEDVSNGINFNIDILTSSEFKTFYNSTLDVNYNLSFVNKTNTTGYFRFYWNDDTGASRKGCLNVVFGSNGSIVCNNCATSATGTLFCFVNQTTSLSLYVGSGLIDNIPLVSTSSLFGDKSNRIDWGVTGYILAFFLVLISFFAFISSPTVSLIVGTTVFLSLAFAGIIFKDVSLIAFIGLEIIAFLIARIKSEGGING